MKNDIYWKVILKDSVCSTAPVASAVGMYVHMAIWPLTQHSCLAPHSEPNMLHACTVVVLLVQWVQVWATVLFSRVKDGSLACGHCGSSSSVLLRDLTSIGLVSHAHYRSIGVTRRKHVKQIINCPDDLLSLSASSVMSLNRLAAGTKAPTKLI